MIIDSYTHILPQKYFLRLQESGPTQFYLSNIIGSIDTLHDVEKRLEIMDSLHIDKEVLTLSGPPTEELFPNRANELLRTANEEIASIVDKNPNRFIGVATVALNHIDRALQEMEYAISTLGLKGVLLYTSVLGKPIDLQEFHPVFEQIHHLDIPIWLHPLRKMQQAEYPSEKESKYLMWLLLGWPFDTSVLATRLVLSGLFDKFPNLKFILHHAGAMVPIFAKRILAVLESRRRNTGEDYLSHLEMSVIDYFKHNFYVDTAVFGSLESIQAAISFWGIEHVLFGSDSPFDKEKGYHSKREALKAVEELQVESNVREAILHKNITSLLLRTDHID